MIIDLVTQNYVLCFVENMIKIIFKIKISFLYLKELRKIK